MDSLGEDLLLVALHPGSGVMRCRGHLPYGLMGAELVELAVAGRIEPDDCLADAIGLTDQLYRGREYRGARKRLREITKSHWAAEPVRRAVAAADAASSGG
jgi:hypothetical protein